MNKSHDVIIIGAGSIGLPLALALSREKISTLVVDSEASPGQGNNKKAIGGIRATHSDFGKIKICQRSIEIFSTWEEAYGQDIGWLQNGYSYPAYSDADEKKLKDLMKVQHSFGLNIQWLTPAEYEARVPGISLEELRGSTYSPGDGSASPLLASNAFYFRSLEHGCQYRFREKVTDIVVESGRAKGVQTDKGFTSCGVVVNAAGSHGRQVGQMIGIDLPVHPECHEGAITEPVARFFGPMIVDMRPAPDSQNYYFYQNKEGQVVFCITPQPSIWGEENGSTSKFLPQVAKRMVSLYPRLALLKVRRSWRGQYPMTPDGFPIVGSAPAVPNYIDAVGMCGQGFMIGPGLGELITRMIQGRLTDDDQKILDSFDRSRSFAGQEQFK